MASPWARQMAAMARSNTSTMVKAEGVSRGGRWIWACGGGGREPHGLRQKQLLRHGLPVCAAAGHQALIQHPFAGGARVDRHITAVGLQQQVTVGDLPQHAAPAPGRPVLRCRKQRPAGSGGDCGTRRRGKG